MPITDILFALTVILLLYGLFWIWDYERQINKLYAQKAKEICETRKIKANMENINGRIRIIEEMYGPKIEEVERKRRFILDKLHFFRK